MHFHNHVARDQSSDGPRFKYRELSSLFWPFILLGTPTPLKSHTQLLLIYTSNPSFIILENQQQFIQQLYSCSLKLIAEVTTYFVPQEKINICICIFDGKFGIKLKSSCIFIS
jgi:hypothetical protein